MSRPQFHSILFDRPQDGVEEASEPAFFRDLNLDQVLEAMTAGREEYDLAPLFHRPLRDADAVRYRQEALRELEREDVRAAVDGFAQAMRAMRAQLAQAERLRHRYQEGSWFLDAVEVYCESVRRLAERLASLDLRSRAFRALRAYLSGYAGSDRFSSLSEETRALKEALGRVRYTVRIRGSRVRVGRYAGETDYSAEVRETFAKFGRGAAQDQRVELPDRPEMDHVEARVLDLVARLHPDVFSELEGYCARHRDYLDATIAAFDREVQFYLAHIEHVRRLESAGLRFCTPLVSARSKQVRARDAFDLALATRLASEGSTVVRNDFELAGSERILVVTGPNQGGKTTFARMVGQLHYLAGLGLSVPGTDAQLFLPDRLFAHFEREEDIATLRGRLEDELVRIRDILREATGESLIVMNESFGSTTLSDALFIGTEVLGRIVGLDALCVYVTFVDELASLGETTVSMMSTVVPDDPSVRTYRVVRKPADGLAYAVAIAEKHGLSYERLRRRIAA